MSTILEDTSHILEGACVILRKLNGARYTQTRVKRNLNVSVENLKFRLDYALIGKPYGIYNVKNGSLAVEATPEEIADYKSVCASTAEPDEIANSDGRGNQTNLVREKVQLKHAKRALTLVQIEKANPRLLSELYYVRNPESVGFLRTDLISYIMEISGIIPGSKVLVFDQCSGVMTAHVLERLNGQGHCVLLHTGVSSSGSISCVTNCQFSKKVFSTLKTLPVRRLIAMQQNDSKTEEVKEQQKPEEEMEVTDQKVQENGDNKDKPEKSTEEDGRQKEAEKEAYSLFKTTDNFPNFGQFDSLLILCRNADACSVLDRTFEAVRSSGTIVVYSADSSVISVARTYLEQRVCVFTNIRSSQCREIQVLKHRTHPLMQHIIPGGYILNGIRCFNP